MAHITTELQDSDNITLAVPTAQMTAEQLLEKRAQRVELCLWQLLTIAKQQTHAGTWANLGLLEAEGFLEALAAGVSHPLIKVWEQRKGDRGAGHPPTIGVERHARRFLVLACIVLRRAGLGKAAARKLVSDELRRTPLFIENPSVTALEHWEARMSALTPADEILLARALTRCGAREPRTLALYFIGMAQSVFNPMARLQP